MSSLPANRTPEQIRSSIEDTRKELAFSVNDLRSKVARDHQLAPAAGRQPHGGAGERGGGRLRDRRRRGRHRLAVPQAPRPLGRRRLGPGPAAVRRAARRLVGGRLGRGRMPRSSRYSRTAIWIEAATGTATSAPRIPSSVPPNSTATITRNGLMSTARFWICGWIRLFSTCW